MADPLFIGITGGSGSGKTSFLRALRKRFSIEELCILSLDDYYIEREKQQKDLSGVTNFDRPGAVDLPAFRRDIDRLRQGHHVERLEYTFNNPQKEPRRLSFSPAPVVALEGLYVFYDPEIRDKVDYKVFIHATPEIKVIRRIRRDGADRNYPLEDVLFRYEPHLLPAFNPERRVIL